MNNLHLDLLQDCMHLEVYLFQNSCFCKGGSPVSESPLHRLMVLIGDEPLERLNGLASFPWLSLPSTPAYRHSHSPCSCLWCHQNIAEYLIHFPSRDNPEGLLWYSQMHADTATATSSMTPQQTPTNPQHAQQSCTYTAQL